MNLLSRRSFGLIKNVIRRQNLFDEIFLRSRILPTSINTVSHIHLVYHVQLLRPHSRRSSGQNIIRRFYADYPPHKVITLPNLSPTMETGSVISWAHKEGEAISEGDLLAEIETDKATMAMDASDNGFMAKILVPAGAKDIPIRTPLCVIVENESDVAAFKEYVVDPTKIASKPKVVESQPETVEKKAEVSATPVIPPPSCPSTVTTTVTSLESTSSIGDRLFVSPYARTLAAERGINLESLRGMGSGPNGRIRSIDLDKVPVGAALTTGMPAYSDLDLSNMRKVIAQRLTKSKQTVPHYYLTVDVNMNNLLDLRKKINKKNEKSSTKLSVNDFIIKAVAVACKRVPECNSSWQETFIRQYHRVDVSVAVATSGGLITPIVYGADSKGLKDINSDVTALAAKAKENKLQPHEFQGGTITVSNLGMFGITNFSAIINDPQSCILAVGGLQHRLIPDDISENGFSKAAFMSVTLCCDHRVVDGAVGAKWLQEFRENIEDPGNMLL